MTDSSRHRDGTLRCQQAAESSSDVGSPLGSRAGAGPQRPMTQSGPEVVIAVEGAVLFFNPFVRPRRSIGWCAAKACS